MFNRRIYLDVAAGMNGPSPRRSWLRPREGGNPSSPHTEGRRARHLLEDARTAIARLVEVQPDDVIFTSGATEANALAILGSATAGSHVLYLPSAHSSIVENIKLLAQRGVKVEALPIQNGRVDCVKLKKLLRPETKLVSVEAVCGETGVVWNIRGIREAIGLKILLHVDASQAPLTEKLTRAHFSADLLTLDGSKVGVRGIGALIAHRTIPLVPLYAGGGQERGLRPGTEVPELAEKFAAALRAAARGRDAFRASATRERERLVSFIKNTLPDVYVTEGSPAGGQAPNILNLSFPGRDTDYLVALLDEAGFAVSTRSACESDSQEGSRAVFVLTGDHARALSTLRISWGPGTRSRALARFAKALARAITFIDTKS
ncbi:MAG: aminotransferase class V-fold PLP-dependent enzyme [Candidatus Paceibacterota bacterium]|jgi:cysteine desulfurase